jgi:hypothetical protein
MELKYGPKDNDISTMAEKNDLMELNPFLLFICIHSNQTMKNIERVSISFFHFMIFSKGNLNKML